MGEAVFLCVHMDYIGCCVTILQGTPVQRPHCGVPGVRQPAGSERQCAGWEEVGKPVALLAWLLALSHGLFICKRD
jgi:hypothetical protein